MYILGLNLFHGDSSACILRDGVLIAAAEEERFRRIKHWAGFPSKAISWCLSEANIALEDVRYISLNQKQNSNFLRKLYFTISNKPNLRMLIQQYKNKKKKLDIKDYLKKNFPNSEFKGDILRLRHHTAHLSSAFHVSPFDKALVVSLDGFGDFASSAWGIGEDIKINLTDRISLPHSLGIFYQALTQYLGFNNYGDEYKVMGLAPYGKPVYLSKMREIVKLSPDGKFKLNLNFFRHHQEKIDYKWDNCAPVIGQLFSNNLEKVLG